MAELSDFVDLGRWPERSRLIVRRERAHPGAQFSFTDHDGHRFTAFLTDSPGAEIAELELRHRRRAKVEDQIRCGKDTGMRNLPFGAVTDRKGSILGIALRLIVGLTALGLLVVLPQLLQAGAAQAHVSTGRLSGCFG